MKPFNLETAVAEWKRQMAANGVQQPEILDELESHLREDVADQTRAGIETESAFNSAIARIGKGSALKKEFKKIRAFNYFTRASRAALAFAGVPTNLWEPSMNDSTNPLEARWATYLRSAVFLAPAVTIWVLASTFVIPQLNLIWLKSGAAGTNSFEGIWRFDLALTGYCKDHFLIIVGAAVLVLGFLELRSKYWPRLRRVFLGTGVFTLNLAILLSLSIQFLAAVLAATALLNH
jgi:hypothetical protein